MNIKPTPGVVAYRNVLAALVEVERLYPPPDIEAQASATLTRIRSKLDMEPTTDKGVDDGAPDQGL
jgi:hypothetical protein